MKIATKNMFMLDGKPYKHIDKLAMGFPSGPILSKFFFVITKNYF